ncbi:unnamed protein product [Blepharisma stoltei]|uniref:Uncharacterized protein n=1 Tax=Blepharisma stoltei TaxID=1481888 RepID=A0AAU9J2Z5_9CILI|nr:unnamed protein product [Blepharisma stoltei]
MDNKVFFFQNTTICKSQKKLKKVNKSRKISKKRKSYNRHGCYWQRRKVRWSYHHHNEYEPGLYEKTMNDIDKMREKNRFLAKIIEEKHYINKNHEIPNKTFDFKKYAHTNFDPMIMESLQYSLYFCETLDF